jgi:hypothetical protein
MEVLIDLPAAELAGPRNLVFTTTPFSPAAAGFSADERQLGVRVYGVELLGAGGQ